MGGEPVLKKASITQRQVGLHCVDFVSWFEDCNVLVFENQLYYEVSTANLATNATLESARRDLHTYDINIPGFYKNCQPGISTVHANFTDAQM